MKKIIMLLMLIMLSATAIAGIPHPVFVDYTGSPQSFEAYLKSDVSTLLHENSVGCGILTPYHLIMVECGNFPVWTYGDTLYIIKTEADSLHHLAIQLDYENVQVQTDADWILGLPPSDQVVGVANEFLTGWNLWSHNFQLTNNAVDSVFASLNYLEKVKSITQSYDPDLDPQFNTLTQIEDGYGYWVNVSQLDSLKLDNATLLDPLQVPIDLDSGWNLIGYIPAVTDSVTHAYAALQDAGILEKVKSITQSYDPNLLDQFNTLKHVSPGYGYWIKLSQDTQDFIYPEPLESITRSCPAEEFFCQPVIYPNSTCAYASIDLSSGQIAAFAGDECRAVTHINQGYVSLVINGLEPETISFVLYENGSVKQLDTKITTSPGEDVFFNLSSGTPAFNTSMSAYPNPFNPDIKIEYSLAEQQNVNISIYNIKGQKINQLKNEIQDKGNHKISWQAHDLSSGIYFIRLKTEDANLSQKVILLK